MPKTTRGLLLVLLSVLTGSVGWTEDVDVALVQDFEGNVELNKWPADKPGEVAFATNWAKDGKRSVRIDPGLMYCISQMKRTNWKGYSVLRLHLMNPGDKAVRVGFELQDKHKSFRYRHQSSFGIVPGENVIEMDIAGGLWRGEENAPYKGLKQKTPIDMATITRIGFTNGGKNPIYLDRIEVVKKKQIKAPGAFAFDFGKANTQVAAQMIGVFHNTAYTPDRGYGLVGGTPGVLGKSMSFPTPMLGDGVPFNKGGFKVDLAGGDYLGLIAFERGGFWSDEDTTYTRASLKLNGTEVHSHTYTRDGKHFLLQDVEATTADEVVEKVILPSHAVARFAMKTIQGSNHFTLETENRSGYPLRVAGLILAPDNEAGRAFMDAHVALMGATIKRTFAFEDRGRRKGRQAPTATLVVEPMAVGSDMYPTDWPIRSQGATLPPLRAVTGQTLTVQLGVYAQKQGQVTVTSAAPTGKGTLKTPAIAHGRYLPMRPYGTGSMWIPINHFRPGATFSCGPQLSRAVILEYSIPKDTPPGTYETKVLIKGMGKTVTLPVSITVAKVQLEPIPIPVGLYMNAVSVAKDRMDASTWWRLQKDLLREQLDAGINVLAGHTGLGLRLTRQGGQVAFTNPDAVRYVKLAKELGHVRAIVGYGGFLPRRAILEQQAPLPDMVAAIKKLEAEGFPPMFLNAYDEPILEQTSSLAKKVGAATKAGVRTVGWTSWHGKHPAWKELAQASYACALNLHTGEDLQALAKLGTEPWVYNNGLDRLGMGLRLWRSMQFGAKGRMQWIGLISQGIAFNNLDGREPEPGCFRLHRELGILKTPAWLSTREGLLDLRIRLALEKRAAADDPALKVWDKAGYRKDEKEWTDARLEATRQRMLQRLIELTAK